MQWAGAQVIEHLDHARPRSRCCVSRSRFPVAAAARVRTRNRTVVRQRSRPRTTSISPTSRRPTGRRHLRKSSRRRRRSRMRTSSRAANDFVEDRENRLPFGLFDQDRAPIWGPTVMYLSEGTDGPATGPIAVTAHDLQVPAKSGARRRQATTEQSAAASAPLTFKAPTAKKLNVLTLTDASGGMQAAATGLVLTKEATLPPRPARRCLRSTRRRLTASTATRQRSTRASRRTRCTTSASRKRCRSPRKRTSRLS